MVLGWARTEAPPPQLQGDVTTTVRAGNAYRRFVRYYGADRLHQHPQSPGEPDALMLDRGLHLAQKAVYYGTWRALDRMQRSPAPAVLHRRVDPLSAGVDETVWRSSGSAVVEPNWGYVIAEPWGLSLDSVGFDFPSRPGYQPPWRTGTPSPRHLHRTRRGLTGRLVEFDEAVSLRYFFEWNYYHFYFDVLGKLALLDGLGLADDLPLVIGPFADHKRFAKEIFSMGAFAHRNWFVQDHDTYVRADRVTYCRPQLTHLERIDYVVDQTQPDRPALAGDRRVLLTRRPPTMRCLANAAEVEPVLEAFGFEVVDTADMPATEQVELFSQTSVLVAIHGAGLTNIIHRAGQPMTIVELCPNGWASDDFKEIAEQLDFDFRRLECRAVEPNFVEGSDIVVDVDKLQEVLDLRRLH